MKLKNLLINYGRESVDISIDAINFEDVFNNISKESVSRYFNNVFEDMGQDVTIKTAICTMVSNYVAVTFKTFGYQTELINKITEIVIELNPSWYSDVQHEYCLWILKQ